MKHKPKGTELQTLTYILLKKRSPLDTKCYPSGTSSAMPGSAEPAESAENALTTDRACSL